MVEMVVAVVMTVAVCVWRGRPFGVMIIILDDAAAAVEVVVSCP